MRRSTGFKIALALVPLTRTCACAVLLFIGCLLLSIPRHAGATLIGDAVSASIQALQSTAAVITQFASPRIVVDPGVEFLGGSFTPNAGGLPLPTQLINSFGIDLDVFASEFQIIILQVPGSITGSTSFIGPVIRVNLSDLNPSGGAFISGITQIAGPTSPIASISVSSPASVAVDFVAFGTPGAGSLPNIYRFQLLTSIAEPANVILLGVGLLVLGAYGRKKLGKKV